MPSLAGERWWRQPPKGGISLARQGGCMVFAAKGGIKMAPKAPYLPSGAVLHTSRGREPSTRPGGVSRSRTESWQPRAERPGGWLNPHAHQGVPTFGNTAQRPTNSQQPTACYFTHPPDECRGFPLLLCAGGRNRRPRGPEGRHPFFLRSGNGHQ